MEQGIDITKLEKIKARKREYYQRNAEKIKAKRREHYQLNAEKIKAKEKEYRQRNAENIKPRHKEYAEKNKDYFKEYQKQYRLKNQESLKIKRDLYRLQNSDKIKTRQRKYYLENADELNKKHREYHKEYRKKNVDKLNEYRKKNLDKIKSRAKAWEAKKRKHDPLFRLIGNLRTRTYIYCRSIGLNKERKTIDSLGCTLSEFKEHMQSKFLDNMTWDNYGIWHVDHIKPISLATNEQEVFELNHYTNLQPLWGKDNLKKGNKYEKTLTM
jgi:hypothetical protein